MTRKYDFARYVRKWVTDFDDMVIKLEEMDSIFTGSGYEAGGADEIVDADIDGLDMTAVDLAQFHSFVTQLKTFMDNGTPAQYDYRAALDAFRNMP